jgi:hemoglobin
VTETTLYARLGGQAAIQAVTEAFYARVLADPRLRGYFEGVGMDGQTRMLAEFLALAFGGPDGYTGRSLREAHAGLGLADADFDAVVTHLGAALSAAGVPEADVKNAAEVAESVRAEVLGR